MKKRTRRSDQGPEKRLNDLIGQLTGRVDRAFLKLGFNRKTLKFDNQPDGKTEASRREPPAFDNNAIPLCPVCGVVPHNLALHDEWRHLPGAKSVDKIAADWEALTGHNDREPRPTSLPASGTSASTGCGICGFPPVFDNWLDINLCPRCGAHETAKGWQER